MADAATSATPLHCGARSTADGIPLPAEASYASHVGFLMHFACCTAGHRSCGRRARAAQGRADGGALDSG
jgi:hypothetical protein